MTPDDPTRADRRAAIEDTDAHWHDEPDRGGGGWLLAVGIIVCVVGCAAILAGAAYGEGARRCAPTASLEAFIADRYGEVIAGHGWLNGSLVVHYVDPADHSWTILQRYAEGASCVLASGTHWEFQGAPEAPKGERG